MIQYLSNNHKEKMEAFVWDGSMDSIYRNIPKVDWHMFHITKNHQLEIEDKPDIVIYTNKGYLVMRVMPHYYFDAPASLLKKYHKIHVESQSQNNHKANHKPNHPKQESLF